MPSPNLDRHHVCRSKRLFASGGNWHPEPRTVNTATYTNGRISVSILKQSAVDYAYRFSSPAASHALGKFIPGCGQARQCRAQSPSCVFATPAGSCPRPDLFSIFRCRQVRTPRLNEAYRSYEWENFAPANEIIHTSYLPEVSSCPCYLLGAKGFDSIHKWKLLIRMTVAQRLPTYETLLQLVGVHW